MTVQYGNGFPQQNQFGGNVPNNSGKGPNTPVPPEVAGKFNWGAFLFNWIWGLGNNTYIALIALAVAFVPFVGGIASLAFSVWLGIKGNELAWQNKQFPSIQAFHEYQKKWVIAYLIFIAVLFTIAVIGIVLALVLGAVSGDSGSY